MNVYSKIRDLETLFSKSRQQNVMKFEKEPSEEFKTPGQFEQESKEQKEKAEYKKWFLDEKTKDFETRIKDKEKEIEYYKDKMNEGSITKKYGEMSINLCEKIITSIKGGRKRKKEFIEWKINNFKKWGPEELQKRIEENKKLIEKKYQPRLADQINETYNRVAEWEIGDLNTENRIIEAIEEGKV